MWRLSPFRTLPPSPHGVLNTSKASLAPVTGTIQARPAPAEAPIESSSGFRAEPGFGTMVHGEIINHDLVILIFSIINRRRVW